MCELQNNGAQQVRPICHNNNNNNNNNQYTQSHKI